MATKRILFVCMGNICRSPAAEAVFRHLLATRGLENDVVVDSAGTDAYHVGEGADARMQAAAQRRGYDLTSIARQVQLQDFEEFDLIIAMDRGNLRRLQGMTGRLPAHLHLLSTFFTDRGIHPDEGEDGDFPLDVPDPYYGGAQGFETVLDMIEAASPPILDHLLAD